MFENTIEQLKGRNLIGENDIVIACMDEPNEENTSAAGMGGAVGGFVAGFAASMNHSKNAKRYLMAVNKDGIRLFCVNKETGECKDTWTVFKKEEILKAKVGFRNIAITIKTTLGKFQFLAGNKFDKHYTQREQLTQLKVFFKANFG